ncbi:flagellar biosynthetic protein FliR [Proteinivorax hydrogeniformans]|uniref:Flagellar biosynthetic protein FliR n=1 Tax=Proteinivorax hydrogeniformans TaxID=1826727 RepID=A0AAU8HP45_9FIRM
MEILQLIDERFITFLLLLVRFSGLFLGTPIFGARNTPTILKVGFAFFCSIIMLPGQNAGISLEEAGIALFLLATKELLIGLIIGYISILIFSSLQFAGQFIDVQMGLGLANVIDPQYGNQIPLVGNFKYTLALLLFLHIDGHHMLIAGLFKSIEVMPLGQVEFVEGLYPFIFNLFTGMFWTGLQVGLPIIGTLFCVNIGLGMVARTVPQINVFVVGIPLKIIVGFLALILVFPFYINVVANLFTNLLENITQFLYILGG